MQRGVHGGMVGCSAKVSGALTLRKLAPLHGKVGTWRYTLALLDKGPLQRAPQLDQKHVNWPKLPNLSGLHSRYM